MAKIYLDVFVKTFAVIVNIFLNLPSNFKIAIKSPENCRKCGDRTDIVNMMVL